MIFARIVQGEKLYNGRVVFSVQVSQTLMKQAYLVEDDYVGKPEVLPHEGDLGDVVEVLWVPREVLVLPDPHLEEKGLQLLLLRIQVNHLERQSNLLLKRKNMLIPIHMLSA